MNREASRKLVRQNTWKRMSPLMMMLSRGLESLSKNELFSMHNGTSAKPQTQFLLKATVRKMELERMSFNFKRKKKKKTTKKHLKSTNFSEKEYLHLSLKEVSTKNLLSKCSKEP